MKYTTTNILIACNIIFFLAFFIPLLANKQIIDAIALKPASILQGNFLWTFLTSMFMHADLVHLFVNMVSLFFIGNLAERLIGKRRYLGLYIISGLFAGIFFVLTAFLLKSNLNAYAVGASGALFGLGGVLMFLTPDLPVYLMFIPVPIKMKYAMPIMLLLLWVLSFTAGLPIGNTAHLGGLIMGLIYGAYLKVKYKKKVLLMQRYFN